MKELFIDRLQNGLSAEWQAIREICCLTGKAGDPIGRDRWPFFSEFWIGPYQKFAPNWAFVARSTDKEAKILGYLIGCPDTSRFEAQKRIYCVPRWLGSVASCQYNWNSDTRRFVRRTLKLEKGPEKRFSKLLQKSIFKEYPAHLHINLLPQARKGGIGKNLIGRYVSDLRENGIQGLHLYCGSGPRDFYLRTGFQVLEHIEFAPGVDVFAMGIKI